MSDFPSLIKLRVAKPQNGTVNLGNSSLSEFNIVNQTIRAKSFEELMLSTNEIVSKKLRAIEQKIDSITDRYDEMEEKVEQIATVLNERIDDYGFDSNSEGCSDFNPSMSGITLISLNNFEDFPDGTWLGDEKKPEMRVRCPIKPSELFHINTTCTTAEKMALTLLDHLFDREVQAYSNISGMGKHKKKKLDPLLIYGIQCHLIAHFGLSPLDWIKIKQNIDSKCRTAFRRKVKGLPLKPKRTSEAADNKLLSATEVLESLFTDDGIVIGEIVHQSELLRDQGEIHILHTTPEELQRIKQTHQIQFLKDGHILATPLTDIIPKTEL